MISVSQGTRHRATAAIVLATALSGCDFIQKILPPAIPQPSPGGDLEIGKTGNGSVNANTIITTLGIQVRLPDSVGGLRGERIVATDPNNAEADITGSGAPVVGFRLALAPANGVERPVQNATVFLRSFDLKLISQTFSLPTDGVGKTFFRFVPSNVLFVADGTALIDGQTSQLFGLVRTEGVGTTAETTLDVASTMAARQLFRFWQMSAYRLRMRDVKPSAIIPMVSFLRDAFRGGVPSDLGLDLTNVVAPQGEPYDAAADASDSALVAFDRLALRVPELERELDSMRRACNEVLLPSGDHNRGPLTRPARLAGGAAITSPSPSAEASATPSADPSATPSAEASATSTAE